MNISKYIKAAFAMTLAVMAIMACKKDEEGEESLPSLSGQLRFEVTPYIEKGSSQTYTPSGVIHPEGKGFGYFWKVSFKDKNDTTWTETEHLTEHGDSTFKFPDELGTYTISCTAFASGYYSTSSSKTVTTVDKEASLINMDKGFSGKYETDTYTDSRDGKTYNTVRIGSLEWFAENLKYSGDAATQAGESESEETPAKIGIAYENSEAMSDIFGRYYTWKEASQACPDGWRLPSEDDWLDLGNALKDGEAELEAFNIMEGIPGKMMVEASFNSEENQMWEYWPDVKITNESGLAVIPCGFANISYDEKGRRVGTFDSDYYLFAAFWSSDEYNAQTDAIGPSGEDGEAFYRYIYWNAPVLQINYASKNSFATTVRCVRDKQ